MKLFLDETMLSRLKGIHLNLVEALKCDFTENSDGQLEIRIVKDKEGPIEETEVPKQKESAIVPKTSVKKSKNVENAEEEAIENPELYERLRKLRSEIAKQHELSTFIVFPNSVLREMSSKLPETRDELLEIPEVGEVRFDRYGTRFLELIRAYKKELDS